MSDKAPKISVVIPVYNVEDYLVECVESVLCQNFHDFEVILVNDGSKDKSGMLCDQLVERDSRVKALHKDNGGVSSARNLGLDHALGDWIYFVDSDDQVQQGLFASFNNMAISDVDVIQFGYKKIFQNNIAKVSRPVDALISVEIDRFVEENNFKTYTLWCHFLRREIIENNKIRFTAGVKYAEDLEFVIKCILVSKKFMTMPIVGYKYYERRGSAMNIEFNYERSLDHLVVAKNLIDFSSKHIVKYSFLLERVEYMVKSFFSTVSATHFDTELIHKMNIDYGRFYDSVKKYGYIRSLGLKIARIHVVLYVMLLKIKMYLLVLRNSLLNG